MSLAEQMRQARQKTSQPKMYVLGVLSSKYVKEVETPEGHKKQFDYHSKFVVDASVIEFLNMHDVEVNEFGNRIFVLNAMKYVFLGEYTKPKKEDFNHVKKEQGTVESLVEEKVHKPSEH